MQERPWFVFAGGGTGGHLFPALGVVEALQAGAVPIDVSFFCTQRPIDREILGKASIEARPLSVQPFPSRPWRWPRFLWRWRESVALCCKTFQDRRPAVVVGSGGYASGPPVAAAMRMGIPTFLLNPDAVPGRANKHLGAKPEIAGVLAQWDVTRKYFPKGASVEVTGCPTRGRFREVASDIAAGGAIDSEKIDQLLDSFQLAGDLRTLLVTGASQGARTINDALADLAETIAAAGWQVLHLSGPADQERLQEAYDRVGVKATVLAFTDRMVEAMLVSDLIISRAGASTLAEILAIGKPSILLPYPYHRDQHQRHNGQVLAEAGAAVLLEDHKDPAANVRQLQPILSGLMQDESKRASMALATRQLGKPDAADTIARTLCEAAGLTERP